jgi:hypothetical protein
MESKLLKKLGIEKVKVVNKDFDKIYDHYNKKAKELGYYGDLKFIKEHGKLIIYVTI